MVNHIARLHPIDDLHPAAEIALQLLCPHAGAVGQADLRHARIQKGRHHSPRCTAGTQDRGWSGFGIPIGRSGFQVFDEPVTIRIVGVDFPVCAEDQCIRRPDQCGAVGYEIRDLHHRFFMGDREIDPHKTHLGQRSEHLCKVARCHIERDIVPRDPVGLKPMAVQLRRFRMGDGRSDHTGKGDFGQAHVSRSPRSVR